MPSLRVEWTIGVTLPAMEGEREREREREKEREREGKGEKRKKDGGDIKMAAVAKQYFPFPYHRTPLSPAVPWQVLLDQQVEPVLPSASPSLQCKAKRVVNWSCDHHVTSCDLLSTYHISRSGVVFGSHFVLFMVTNHALKINQNLLIASPQILSSPHDYASIMHKTFGYHVTMATLYCGNSLMIPS